MPAEASARPADWLVPPWADEGVGAVMSTRRGGVGEGRFESMNLRHGLGDVPQAVEQNLALFAQAIGAAPAWLQQVHGARVVRIAAADARPGAPAHEADASVTTEPGVACCVQVADCLPLLFAAPHARGAAAAHAGWRGLALGVVEATVQTLCEAAGCEPGHLQVWLGPSIGPRRFEVGADVLRAFGADPTRLDQPHFRTHVPGKWMADLCGLARDRLMRAGVSRISGGDWCTVEDASRFFSFRRDGVTGRMAAAVWLRRLG